MTIEIVNSYQALQSIIGTLRQAFKEHHYIRLTWKVGTDRSLDANAVTHVWYSQIARELGDTTAAKVKAECKLLYGVPILRGEDADFAEMYDRLIKNRYTYEEKLELIAYLPVTSRMTTDQMNRYRDEVQQAYATSWGIVLEYKD